MKRVESDHPVRYERSGAPPGGALTWADYQDRHDPPGLEAFAAEYGRDDAWSWYWRRAELAEQCKPSEEIPTWPRCLVWSEETCAEVSRALALSGEPPAKVTLLPYCYGCDRRHVGNDCTYRKARPSARVAPTLLKVVLGPTRRNAGKLVRIQHATLRRGEGRRGLELLIRGEPAWLLHRVEQTGDEEAWTFTRDAGDLATARPSFVYESQAPGGGAR